MEHEPENQNKVEMPKFCPECGSEMVEILEVPDVIEDFDLDAEGNPVEKDMFVCTMCTYEEVSEEAARAFLEAIYQDKWQEINNALPDVTLPEKVYVQNKVSIIPPDALPDSYKNIYTHLFLAELYYYRLQKKKDE